MMRNPVSVGITLALALIATSAVAGETVVWHELNLVDASGVPGDPKHGYFFKGVLNIYTHSSSSGFSFSKGGFYSSSSTNLAASYWVQGKGSWQDSDNTARELLQLQTQNGTDTLSATFKCNGDPWITSQSCVVVKAAFNTSASSGIRDWAGMVNKYRRPLTVHVVTLEQAAALSQKHQAGAPPPPPPPPAPKPNKPATLKRPTTPGPLALGKQPMLPSSPTKRPATGGSLQASTKPALPGGPADLASGPSVVLGGTTARWGRTVTVDAAAARTRNLNGSGVCEFTARHTARNIGLSSTGTFDSLWQNSATPGSSGRSWLPLGPGQQHTETDTITLKPGTNKLSLQLDPGHHVKESNTANNHYSLTVNLTGSCGVSATVGRVLHPKPTNRIQLPSR